METSPNTQKIISTVVDTLSAKLVAYMLGITNSQLLINWKRDPKTIPNDIWPQIMMLYMILDVVSFDSVKARRWFLRQNDNLWDKEIEDNQSPGTAFREGKYVQVYDVAGPYDTYYD